MLFVWCTFGYNFVFSKSISVQCDETEFNHCFLDDFIDLRGENELYIINPHFYRRPVERILEIRPRNRSYISSIKSIFYTFPQLEQIYISNSLDEMPSLQHGQFLQKIHFRRNFIEKLKSNSFIDAPQTEYINLSGNLIAKIDNNTFAGLKSVQSIHLEENKLTSLSNDTFAGADTVTYINLEKNSITLIKHGCFHLKHLKVLILSHNLLDVVTVGIFSGATSLQKLFLNHNRIKFINLLEIAQNSPLLQLQLEDNQLSRYDGYTNTSIVNDSIKHNSILKHLNLANNQLKNPLIFDQLKCFENLESLNLNYNDFTHLDNVVNLKIYFPHISVIFLINSKLECDWLRKTVFDTSLVYTRTQHKHNVNGIACYEKRLNERQ